MGVTIHVCLQNKIGQPAHAIMVLIEYIGIKFSLSAYKLVVSLTADPVVMSSIPTQSHTFVDIDHGMIYMVIFFLPLIQDGLLSGSRESMFTKYWLTA